MASSFGQLLSRIAAEKGTQRDLSVLLEYDQGVLNHIMLGKRRVPLHHVVRWADALELTGLERGRFFEAALRDHAPDVLAELSVRLKG